MSVKKDSDLSPDEGIALRDAGRRFINSYRGRRVLQQLRAKPGRDLQLLDPLLRGAGLARRSLYNHRASRGLVLLFPDSEEGLRGTGVPRGRYPLLQLPSPPVPATAPLLGVAGGRATQICRRERAGRHEAPQGRGEYLPTVTDEQLADLVSQVNPQLARTPLDVFRLTRNNSVLSIFVDTPGRLQEVATMKVDDVLLEEEKIRVMGKGRRQRFMPI